jgi:hypothetical protein
VEKGLSEFFGENKVGDRIFADAQSQLAPGMASRAPTLFGTGRCIYFIHRHPRPGHFASDNTPTSTDKHPRSKIVRVLHSGIYYLTHRLDPHRRRFVSKQANTLSLLIARLSADSLLLMTEHLQWTCGRDASLECERHISSGAFGDVYEAPTPS